MPAGRWAGARPRTWRPATGTRRPAAAAARAAPAPATGTCAAGPPGSTQHLWHLRPSLLSLLPRFCEAQAAGVLRCRQAPVQVVDGQQEGFLLQPEVGRHVRHPVDQHLPHGGREPAAGGLRLKHAGGREARLHARTSGTKRSRGRPAPRGHVWSSWHAQLPPSLLRAPPAPATPPRRPPPCPAPAAAAAAAAAGAAERTAAAG